MMITNNNIAEFERHLVETEHAGSTVKQYIRAMEMFMAWLGGRAADKAVLVEYKEYLRGRYKPASVNMVIAALNSFVKFNGCPSNWQLRALVIQRRLFSKPERELTANEFDRLAATAKRMNKPRLLWIIHTMLATGIRVSELCFVTVEAVKNGRIEIDCKGKHRTVGIPHKLYKGLKAYAKENKIKSGCIFITRSGAPVDRSNIWRELKRLAAEAGVMLSKVFPHNLRHLFARTFYERYKDIVRLADILGHASISTTRIYTIESGEVHQRMLNEICRI